MKKVSVELRFNEDCIRPFYMIVETYDHKNYGRGKRLYLKEFTEQERKTISEYHSKLYGWFMRTGIPYGGVIMQMKTFELLQRASNFFSTI